MYPELAEIFGQSIPAYTALLVLGFGLATWLGSRWAKRSGLNHDTIIDLGLFALIAGVAGARILHVLADGYFWDYVHLCTDPSQVAWHITRGQCVEVEGVWDAAASVCRPKEADCFAWLAFWNGGLTYYGGLIAASAFGLWFLKRERFPILKACDMAGMTIPLGLFFGRIGCFLGGCCFGTPTDHFSGVSFPAWSAASVSQWRAGMLSEPYVPSLPVHPAQLYESLGSLAIAAAMMLWLHPRKKFDGEVFLVFLGAYAALRFVLEFFRADDRGAVLGLSTSQWIGVAVVAVVAFVWVKLRSRKTPAAATSAGAQEEKK